MGEARSIGVIKKEFQHNKRLDQYNGNTDYIRHAGIQMVGPYQFAAVPLPQNEKVTLSRIV